MHSAIPEKLHRPRRASRFVRLCWNANPGLPNLGPKMSSSESTVIYAAIGMLTAAPLTAHAAICSFQSNEVALGGSPLNRPMNQALLNNTSLYFPSSLRHFPAPTCDLYRSVKLNATLPPFRRRKREIQCHNGANIGVLVNCDIPSCLCGLFLSRWAAYDRTACVSLARSIALQSGSLSSEPTC